MFDAYSKIDPSVFRAGTGAPGYNALGWTDYGTQVAQGRSSGEQGAEQQYQTIAPLNWASDPSYLKSLGFTGEPLAITGYGAIDGSGSGDSGGGTGLPQYGLSPELQQWMADNGLTARINTGEAGSMGALFNASGQQAGNGVTWSDNDDPGGWFGLAALAAGGLVGGAVASAGAAAGGTGAASGGGLSSADLAALYGDAGYGAAATEASSIPVVGNAGGLSLGGAGAGADSFAGQVGASIAGPSAAGTGGGSAITNSVLADSAANSAGYGASSVGGGLASGSTAFDASLANLGSGLGDYLGSTAGLKTLGGLGSTALQAYQSGNALKAQTAATNSANALSKYVYDTNRADNAPLLATRNTALTGLNALMTNPSSITSDPGYQFGLSQGTQALDRSAVSKGALYSGATLKALDRYGTDYGQTKLSDSFSRLSSAAGLGATATNSNTYSGTNYAGTVGNNTTGLGNAAAGNALYNGTLYGNLLNSAVSTYTNKPGG